MFPFLLATAFSFNPDGSRNDGLVAFFLVLYTIVSLLRNHNLTLSASICNDLFHASCVLYDILLIMKLSQAYSPGAGVVPFLYSSEIFPQILRGTSHSSCWKNSLV